MRSHLYNPKHRRLISVLLASVLAAAGCSAPSSGTTTPAADTTAAGSASSGQITLEGLVLTNGTIYITKSPSSEQLTHELITIQMPADSQPANPGALMEFVILDAIRESYPMQASGVSSKVISETSPSILAPIELGQKLLNHMAADAYLLDVRTPEEFAEGHIEGSINLPLDEVEAKISTVVPDQTKTIMIYCRSGNRSNTAAQQLKGLNYSIVFDLGGVNGYQGELIKGAN